MLEKSNIREASELVKPGEIALVVFTRGMHFYHDDAGNGQTGHWVAGANTLTGVDKVIIYRRDQTTGVNRIYIANFLDWIDSPEEGRKILRFSGLQDKGLTSSNWFEFGGNAFKPTFYV